jgi:hypothetical protein
MDIGETMENKSCENCRRLCDEKTKYIWAKDGDCRCFLANYPTLESEVKKLTDFIREYQKAINNYHKIKSQLSTANQEINELIGYLNEAVEVTEAYLEDSNYKVDCFITKQWKQALFHPAPVDEEKEVLKKALRFSFDSVYCASCNLYVKFCNGSKDNQSCCEVFINQAQSKIEAVK